MHFAAAWSSLLFQVRCPDLWCLIPYFRIAPIVGWYSLTLIQIAHGIAHTRTSAGARDKKESSPDNIHRVGRFGAVEPINARITAKRSVVRLAS
jgi:hypothetical protein